MIVLTIFWNDSSHDNVDDIPDNILDDSHCDIWDDSVDDSPDNILDDSSDYSSDDSPDHI